MEPLAITDNVKNIAYAVYAVMLATSLIVYISEWIFKKDMAGFKLRLKSFWLIVILFTVAFSFNKVFAFFFLALINYLALKEFFSLIQTRRADRRVLLWAYLAIPIQFYFIYIGWIVMFYLFVPLYMLLLIPARMVWIGDNEGFLKSCGTIHWGLTATVYALGYLAAFLIIPVEKNPAGGAVGMLLCILILTVFNDFAQFLLGKSFGKHKIIPKVSPNKTWEGFIGGVIATSLLALFLVPYLTPSNLLLAGGAGFVIAVTGFLGDVTMSAIKRDIGVKDTSTLLPGHGGILDRLDSLVFTAPLFFHYTVFMNKIDLYIPF
jgi:phosphatidate cytidylyltransferase